MIGVVRDGRVASRSVSSRERSQGERECVCVCEGHSCPAHAEEKGTQWATVAWRLPGLGLDIYMMSPR